MKPIIALLTAATLLTAGPAFALSGGGVTLPHLTFPVDDAGAPGPNVVRSDRDQ